MRRIFTACAVAMALAVGASAQDSTVKSKTTVKVKKGKHTFQITATDAVGNVSAAAKFSWRVTR